MSSVSGPHTATADNYGPIVNAVSWVFMVSTVLGVVARVATRIAVSRGFGLDDGFIFIALVI